MKKNVFELNRKKLIEKLDDNSLLILLAGEAPKKTADEQYEFTPNRNFYYLTGINEEKHILVISKIDGEVTEKMFIKEIDLEMERWLGKTIRKEEVEEVNGIKEVSFLGELKGYLNRLLGQRDEFTIYLDLERDNFESLPTEAGTFAKKLRNKYAHVKVKNAFPLFASLRLVKSEGEIEEMRKAIEITIAGVESVMKNIKPGMKEYETEAYFEFECRRRGVRDYAFKTIAAAGVNATTLHYVANNDTLKDGDLMLFDLGAQWKYYNGDISRTIPINGKFTERQKEVYEAVLSVNERVIEAMKPGVNFVELNNQATEWIAEECIKLGLIEDKKDVRKYYFHSIGHSLGLDTHDIDNPGRKTILEPGMVYTVEPGIYIPEEEIGIRVEDDILITENGNEVLTKDMIKTVKEIEDFMSK
ncbi:aminopeptidase P family protein [uncultured Clostridium sp.]|uniref:aminopeptidase P family protein n=1 Tax=uncultured Clostridium sp. TaxID=59620 RepID=UPI002626E907|nr:aminopeptidase P family protein [uncultured Clostridium sp.]